MEKTGKLFGIKIDMKIYIKEVIIKCDCDMSIQVNVPETKKSKLYMTECPNCGKKLQWITSVWIREKPGDKK